MRGLKMSNSSRSPREGGEANEHRGKYLFLSARLLFLHMRNKLVESRAPAFVESHFLVIPAALFVLIRNPPFSTAQA
jgi:hypothetical protein